MKTKIRIASLVLALCMVVSLFTACTAAPDNSNIAAAEVYDALMSKVEFPEMLSLDAGGLVSLLGIDDSLYTEAVAYIPLTAVSGNMVFIVKATDSAAAETLAEKLESYRAGVLAQMNNYLPDEYDKINAASVETDGSFVWLVVADDQAAAEAAVRDIIG
ncbi:MAG: DUF4358 domain-containing protein [Clostridia bacterium]|nr:DUF4358 domain-containing protein [Clostridia bacterium]